MASFCTLTATAAVAPARAGRPQSSPFHKGVFYGQIIDAASGKPVPDATVALRDRHGKVAAWARTDTQGRYALAADSLGLLDLSAPHHRGMLETLGRGMVQVVELPIKVVGVAADAAEGVAVNTVKSVDPVGTVKAALVSAAEGTPVPLASKLTGDAAGVLGIQTQTQARDNAAQAAVNTNYTRKDTKKQTGPAPGEVALLVSAPQYKQFQGVAGSYCLQPPVPDNAAPCGTRAWLDTVRLAATSAKQDSDTQDRAAQLSEPMLDPAMAAAGSPVKITVKLQMPPEPDVKVCVVAREQKTHRVAELTPQGNGVYAGTLTLDPKTPTGDTVVTVAALSAVPLGVDLPSNQKDNPLLDYASHLDALDTNKPYHFDPRTMASENRLDVKMLILDPTRETPPAPAPPPMPAATMPPLTTTPPTPAPIAPPAPTAPPASAPLAPAKH